MTSSVYHFHYQNDNLPNEPHEIATFAREAVATMTGGRESEVTHFIQPNQNEPSCRLTISVPDRLGDLKTALHILGAQAAHQEPELPHIDGSTIVLPGSYVARTFGFPVQPEHVRDNPNLMYRLASEAASAIPELPTDARDTDNWLALNQDDRSGTLLIEWKHGVK